MGEHETKPPPISKKPRLNQLYCGRNDLEKIPILNYNKKIVDVLEIPINELNEDLNNYDNKGNLRLKIATFNVNGAHGSRYTIKYVAEQTNVLCLQETMHQTKELLHEAIKMEGKKIFQLPGKREGRTGRYSGGQAFVVSNEINALPFFPFENISYILINHLAIINVYLPFYDGDNSINYDKYIQDIVHLDEVIEKLVIQNKQIILLGDLNLNFVTMNGHAKLMKKLLKKYDLFPEDLNHNQYVNYTYNKKYLNNTTRTTIT